MSGGGTIDLVLASTSRYRRELLARIVPDFRQLASAVDETPQPDEAPSILAQRLARAKAQAVSLQCPGAIVIGSDQVAELDGIAVGKPGDRSRAQAQLLRASGRTVTFHTAVCVIDARHSPSTELQALDCTRVCFRKLDAAEIARYLERERPYDCAGSFKAEGLGIALFERIESHDPTALIGLPLIALSRLLRERGVAVI